MNMPTPEQVRSRALKAHEWVHTNTEGDTLTHLAWRRVDARDHRATRSGWSWRVLSTDGYAVLSGRHEDGRKNRSSHMSLAAAKQAAYGFMAPCEKFGMKAVIRERGIVGGAVFQYAVAGRFTVVALNLPDGTFHLSAVDWDTRAVVANGLCGSVGDVRYKVAGFLRDALAGPPETPSAPVTDPCEALAMTLLDRGVKASPAEIRSALTIAGLTLDRR